MRFEPATQNVRLSNKQGLSVAKVVHVIIVWQEIRLLDFSTTLSSYHSIQTFKFTLCGVLFCVMIPLGNHNANQTHP